MKPFKFQTYIDFINKASEGKGEMDIVKFDLTYAPNGPTYRKYLKDYNVTTESDNKLILRKELRK